MAGAIEESVPSRDTAGLSNAYSLNPTVFGSPLTKFPGGVQVQPGTIATYLVPPGKTTGVIVVVSKLRFANPCPTTSHVSASETKIKQIMRINFIKGATA